VPDIYLCM